jgi:hypothetical protein
MIKEKIEAAEDVLDDVTLQYLSATCPQGKEVLITDSAYLLLSVCRQTILHLSTI